MVSSLETIGDGHPLKYVGGSRDLGGFGTGLEDETSHKVSSACLQQIKKVFIRGNEWWGGDGF